MFVYAKAGQEGRGNREKGSRGSVGSRHERKSREEGCGGFVFMTTDTQKTVALCVSDSKFVMGHHCKTKPKLKCTAFIQLVNFSGSAALQHVNDKKNKINSSIM